MNRRTASTTCLLAGVILMALVGPGGRSAGASTKPNRPSLVAAAATTAANPLQLVGEGSDDPTGEVTAWETELYGSAKDLSVSYNIDGDFGGRQNYIDGLGDFVISGQPFTPSDLARLKGGASSLIAAPVMVSALGILAAWTPTYTLHRACAQGDTTCKPTSVYEGQINVPSNVLTAMLWPSNPANAGDADANGGCSCFGDPGIIAATEAGLPQGRDTAPPTVTTTAGNHLPPPLALMRADPSETNYAIQQYAAMATPGEFFKLPHFSPPITEFLQGEADSQDFATYDGLDNQIGYATSTSTQSGSSAASHFGQGVVIGVPPSASVGIGYVTPRGLTAGVAIPPTPPVWIGVENANGQYVAPSPASIDAAVDAGGSTPLYALSHPVAGTTPAYPLTYVNDLYAPSHGLSADKAEAMATTIRYLATAGQDATASQNDGRLSQPLVDQALAAANQVIASNCTQSGEQVVLSSSIGRYAPVLSAMDGKTAAQRQAELAGIGPMLHCVTVAFSPTTPTTTPTSSTTANHTTSTIVTPPATVPPTPGVLNQVAPAATVPTTTPPQSSSTTEPRSAAATAPKAKSPPVHHDTGPVTLLALPLGFPGGADTGFNHLVSFVFGGGLFLVLWRSRKGLSKVLGR